MGNKWTPAQETAIQAYEGRYLVSAGAGSGKTAVLTERIKRLVLEKHVSLSSLLVLTFTNKAAHEMKGRVRDAFLAINRLDLAEEVETSDITTFDAFALKLVKKYHYALGLPSDISLLSEGDFDLEKKKLLDAILLEHYEAKDPLFLDFVHHYAFKNDDTIVAMTLTLYEKADLSGDKRRFIDQAAETYFSPAFIESQYQKFVSYLHEQLLTMRELTSHYENADFASKEQSLLDPLLAIQDYDELYLKLSAAKYPQLPQSKDVEKSDFDKAIHTSLNKNFNAIRKSIVFNGTKAESLSRLQALKPYAGIWMGLVKELDERLSAYKRHFGVFTFADIAFYAQQAALMPALQGEMRQHYRFLMVDEFQDTSDLQYGFLRALDGGNFFAVGDIKQAIYRFRHANPALFLATQKEFEAGGGQLIILQDNFRSREEVISSINALFSELMSKQLGDVDYDQSQVLGYGNKNRYSASTHSRYQIETYCYDKIDGRPIAESEARLIAEDIREKLESGFPVVGDQGSLRPCRMGDFAILISRKKDFPLYQRLFSEAKLSLSVSNDQDLSSQDVSLLMESFLRLGLAIDQDEATEKHCYASIMRSYLYGEKDPEIYQDIQSGSYRHSPLFNTLRADRPFLAKASSYEAVRYFLDHFPFYEKLELLGDVVDNYEKLSSFLMTARSRDHLGGSYASFLAYFDDLKAYDEKFALPEPQDEGDSIKLMSIHASKGLQFPIVYCPDLGAGVNTKNIAPAFNFSFDHGFVFPSTLGEGSPEGVLQPLVYNDELRSSLSEKMRLYYVALTRAEEKVILLERKRPKLNVYRVDALHILKVKSTLDKKGKPALLSSLVSPKSFHEFNDLAAHFAFHRQEKKVPSQITPYLPKNSAKEDDTLPDYRKIALPPVLVEPLRASKQSLEPVDEGALLRGDVLHRYLEVADFKSKDVSYIADPNDRSLIAKVLSLPLFSRTSDATFLPEDSFYDEENDIHGAIDLLILYPEKAIVVDYKTKEIDDPAYPKQLAIYRHYVEKIYGKPCTTYLLSILGGYLKEVK